MVQNYGRCMKIAILNIVLDDIVIVIDNAKKMINHDYNADRNQPQIVVAQCKSTWS